MSKKKSQEEPGGSRQGSGGIRIPPILMIPVGLLVGWLVANWLGAIFGGVMGVFLWKSRS